MALRDAAGSADNTVAGRPHRIRQRRHRSALRVGAAAAPLDPAHLLVDDLFSLTVRWLEYGQIVIE